MWERKEGNYEVVAPTNIIDTCDDNDTLCKKNASCRCT